MNEISVRIGVVEDFNELMRLALEATNENAIVRPSTEKLAEAIYGALIRKIGIAGVIGGKPGEKLEAAIILHFGELWYSRELILEEKAIFVDPEFRSAKGGRAKKLTEFAKLVSDTNQMPLAIGVLSNSRTEAKIRLYERAFGAPAGVYFLYGAKTGLNGET